MESESKIKRKTYYLESEKQFWELEIDSETTTIRYGKKGCKGRRCPSKTHASYSKAVKFSLIQANAKIMQGFEDPHAKLKLTPRLVSRRSTMRKSIAGTGSPVKSARSWKKPPKKRDSIRKLSRQSTARALQRGQSSTASASTVVLSGTSDVNSSSHTDAPLCTPVQKWRKPPKKQSTIRRLALSNSQSIRGSTRRPALAKQDTLLLSADQTFAQTPLNSSMEMMPVLSNKRDSTRLRQKRDKKDFLSQDTVEMPSLSFYGEESPPKQPKHAKKRGKR